MSIFKIILLPLKLFANTTVDILRIFSELSVLKKNKKTKMVLGEDLTEREGLSPHEIS